MTSLSQNPNWENLPLEFNFWLRQEPKKFKSSFVHLPVWWKFVYSAQSSSFSFQILQDDFRMTSGWLQDDFRMSSGWVQDEFRMTSGWLQEYFEMTSGWLRDDFRMTLEWLQDDFRVPGKYQSTGQAFKVPGKHSESTEKALRRHSEST